MQDDSLTLLPLVLADEDKFDKLKNDKDLKIMLQHFEKSAPVSFGMSAFELGNITGIKFDKWNELLNLPSMQKFIQEQTSGLIDIASRAALVNLGDAEKSVDVQKVKAFADLKKSQSTNDRKPFNILMFPAEVKKYKNALVKIRDLEGVSEEVLEIVHSVIKHAN